MFKDTATLKECVEEVLDHFKEVGISVDKNIPVTFNTRINITLGYCYRNDGRYKIEVHKDLWKYPEKLKNTLAHEFLHTLPGCFNHGTKFFRMADKLKYKINTTDTNPVARYKYEIHCPNCGFLGGYTRMCKSIREIKCGLASCKKCGCNSLEVKKV